VVPGGQRCLKHRIKPRQQDRRQLSPVNVPVGDQLISSSDQQPIGRAPADVPRFARALMDF
jgi:hypothetical protein